MNIKEKLDELQKLRLARQNMIEPWEIKLAELNQQIQELVKPFDEQIKPLEKEIQLECLDLQQSIKGENLQVVYFKGRTSLDTKTLETKYPQIYDECKKVGEPYTIITVVKSKD